MEEEHFENNLYEDDYSENDDYEEIDEYEEFEYFQDTINIIFEEFSYIINKKDLPIGEYITPIKIEKFVENLKYLD